MEDNRGIKISYNRETDEFGFWKKYFQAYNFNRSKSDRFTDFQLDAVALLMSSDYYKSPFIGDQRQKFIETLNEMGYKFKSGNVYGRIVKPFLDSNILYKSEDDVKRGEYSINPQLKKVQKYIKEKIKKEEQVHISIAFNITIGEFE